MNAFLVALSLLVQTAYAGDRYSSLTSIKSVNASQVLTYVPGSIENMRQPIISDLVSSDMPQLDYPPFPRIWTERTKSETLVSNTKLGAKVPIIDLGGRLSLEFRYTLKTSFIIISSKRKAEKNHHKSSSRVSGIPTMSDEVLSFDEGTFQTYPNVRPGYPMVGLCVFEASLAIEKTAEGGFDFLVAETVKKGTVETMSNAIFSNFFQLQGHVGVSTYLEGTCNDIFKKEVEAMVVNDFSKLVMEKVVAQNPESDCAPSRSSEDIENGDASCLDWQQSFSRYVQDLTVPRCMLQQNGVHRCRLKAREGTACDMYVDPQTKTFSPTFKNFDRTILATEDNYAYSCDKKMGLTCVMEKKPTLLHGIPIFTGKARCQAQQN